MKVMELQSKHLDSRTDLGTDFPSPTPSNAFHGVKRGIIFTHSGKAFHKRKEGGKQKILRIQVFLF